MSDKTNSRLKHALTLSATLVLAACGGGGSDTSSYLSTSAVPAAPANPVTVPVMQAASVTTVYAGPISGFGSVIVNGMRFDTLGARLSDDDGNEVLLQDLSLGMTVSVDGTTNDTTARGSASALSLVHGNTGPITAIDAANQSLTVSGMAVKTTPSTAYKDVASLAALAVGDVVEVYGALQSDNTVLATLVDKEGVGYTNRLVGRISGLNTVAKTFQVGSMVVQYGSAMLSGALTDGAQVKVKAAQAPVSGVLTASVVKVSDGAAYGATVNSGSFLKIKGVAETAPVNGLLTVSGTRVNVSQVVYAGGTSIVAGDFVEIKGKWDGSVLQATQVEMERNDRDNDGYSDRNELYGAVSAITNDANSRVIVNGVTVDVSQAYFKAGSRSQLAVGVPVEIKGVVQGNVLMASKVELKSGFSSNSGGSSSSVPSSRTSSSNDSSNSSAGSSVSSNTSDSRDSFEYEQYGLVTDFVSLSNFKVNGVQVDASAARFEKGGITGLGNRTYVEIKGAQNAQGIFIARDIELKTSRYGS